MDIISTVNLHNNKVVNAGQYEGVSNESNKVTNSLVITTNDGESIEFDGSIHQNLDLLDWIRSVISTSGAVTKIKYHNGDDLIELQKSGGEITIPNTANIARKVEHGLTVKVGDNDFVYDGSSDKNFTLDLDSIGVIKLVSTDQSGTEITSTSVSVDPNDNKKWKVNTLVTPAQLTGTERIGKFSKQSAGNLTLAEALNLMITQPTRPKVTLKYEQIASENTLKIIIDIKVNDMTYVPVSFCDELNRNSIGIKNDFSDTVTVKYPPVGSTTYWILVDGLRYVVKINSTISYLITDADWSRSRGRHNRPGSAEWLDSMKLRDKLSSNEVRLELPSSDHKLYINATSLSNSRIEILDKNRMDLTDVFIKSEIPYNTFKVLEFAFPYPVVGRIPLILKIS